MVGMSFCSFLLLSGGEEEATTSRGECILWTGVMGEECTLKEDALEMSEEVDPLPQEEDRERRDGG